MTLAEYVYTVLLKPEPIKSCANAFIKALVPDTVRVGNAEICLNPEDPVISGALTFRVYERSEITLFRRLYRPGMTFVDVGANVGLYTALALSMSAQARILCLEPDIESFSFLQKTVELNRTDERQEVVMLRLAASESNGAARLYRNACNKGDNRLYPDAMLRDAIPVRMRTLDSLCEKHGFAKIDFLKIDVQGAEARVLAGAARTLDRSADCIVMTELWPGGLSSCGSDPELYLRTLQRHEFDLYEIGRALLPIGDPSTLLARYSGRRYTNILGLKGAYRALAREAGLACP
jgi:FkbM family methyltransferase